MPDEEWLPCEINTVLHMDTSTEVTANNGLSVVQIDENPSLRSFSGNGSLPPNEHACDVAACSRVADRFGMIDFLRRGRLNTAVSVRQIGFVTHVGLKAVVGTLR